MSMELKCNEKETAKKKYSMLFFALCSRAHDNMSARAFLIMGKLQGIRRKML